MKFKTAIAALALTAISLASHATAVLRTFDITTSGLRWLGAAAATPTPFHLTLRSAARSTRFRPDYVRVDDKLFQSSLCHQVYLHARQRRRLASRDIHGRQFLRQFMERWIPHDHREDPFGPSRPGFFFQTPASGGGWKPSTSIRRGSRAPSMLGRLDARGFWRPRGGDASPVQGVRNRPLILKQGHARLSVREVQNKLIRPAGARASLLRRGRPIGVDRRRVA